MAFICSVCGGRLPTIRGLCIHLQLVHAGNLLTIFKCGQGGCFREYDSLRVFKRHLHTKHHDLIPNDHIAIPDERNHIDEDEESDNDVPSDDDVNGHDLFHVNVERGAVGMRNNILPVRLGVVEFRNIVFKSALALAAKLYSSPTLNRTQVQDALDYVKEFSGGAYLDAIRGKTLTALRESNAEAQKIEELSVMFDIMENMFNGLETEHQRTAILTASDCFMPLESYHIGVGERRVRIGGNIVRQPVDLKGQFISMKKVLKKYLELPGVYAAIQRNVEHLKASNTFSNFIQGSLWKHIEQTHFVNKIVLPLFVYYDDVEPGSETAAHSGDYKIGAVYYQIPCIPQHLVSTLKNIFVAAVFLSNDRSLNNGAAFAPIIDDIVDLERNGIQIQTETGDYTVHFGLGLLLGDNLGMHQITGFVEVFTANYFCRFCKEHRTTMRAQLRENELVLRNRQNYDEDLAVNNLSHTGIRSGCVWNRLLTFHVTENLTADLMHDLWEGACHYVICRILNYVVSEAQFLSLDTLNERVQNFDYGKASGKRPHFITLDRIQGDKLKMSASEMMFFVAHLGIIIGDLVPQADEVWKLYVIHTKILDILRRPSVRRNELEYLKALIEEHHSLYCRLFNLTLKPKFHFMLHYIRIMLLIGPLIHVWSMRMEGKHRPVVKLTASNITCRKNLPLSVATRYLFSLCGDFLSQAGFPREVVYGSQEKIIIQCEHYQEFQNVLPPGHEQCLAVTEVQVRGTVYSQGKVVVFNYEDDLPLFGKIEWILKRGNNPTPLFILSGFYTVGFLEHYHAYRLNLSPEWFCVAPEDLISFYTTVTNVNVDGGIYVVFPHVL